MSGISLSDLDSLDEGMLIEPMLINSGANDGAWHSDQYHLGQEQKQKIDIQVIDINQIANDI